MSQIQEAQPQRESLALLVLVEAKATFLVLRVYRQIFFPHPFQIFIDPHLLNLYYLFSHITFGG